MSDITERLRDKVRMRRVHGLTGWVLAEEALREEAASEIERLRARELELKGEWETQCERARFLKADIERLRDVVEDARAVIGRGVDLMTKTNY